MPGRNSAGTVCVDDWYLAQSNHTGVTRAGDFLGHGPVAGLSVAANAGGHDSCVADPVAAGHARSYDWIASEGGALPGSPSREKYRVHAKAMAMLLDATPGSSEHLVLGHVEG